MATSEYQVVIENSGLNTSPPSNGFIDPTTVKQYCANLLTTGSSFGTVAAAQFVMINNYPVTLTGSTIADVVADINAQSAQHHAVASNNGGDLALINEPLYNFPLVSVCDGTPGITAQLGFDNPTTATANFPSTLAQSEANVYANWRWNFIMQRFGQTMTVNTVHGVIVSGATQWTVDPTSIQFNVIFDNDSVYAYDNNNNLVYGVAAVQAAVAMALMDSNTLIGEVYDPTNNPPPAPNPPPAIAIGDSAYQITIGALTDDYATAISAITVTFVE